MLLAHSDFSGTVTVVPYLFAWIGAASASLLCLVVDRARSGDRLTTARSRCVCGRELRLFEVLPVISWIALRGRSRCCSSPLPWRWPLEELLGGIGFFIGAHLDPLPGVLVSIGLLAVAGAIELLATRQPATPDFDSTPQP